MTYEQRGGGTPDWVLELQASQTSPRCQRCMKRTDERGRCNSVTCATGVRSATTGADALRQLDGQFADAGERRQMAYDRERERLNAGRVTDADAALDWLRQHASIHLGPE